MQLNESHTFFKNCFQAQFKEFYRRRKSLFQTTSWFFVCRAAGVDKPGSHVGPGQNFTYTWQVLEGPSSSDSPCIPYLYFSATDPAADTNSGLVGPLLVCKKGTLAENGAQVALHPPLAHTFSHREIQGIKTSSRYIGI